MPLLLEVIACSVVDAVEAERGGAGRLEIVRALDRGGLTPPSSLVREIRERTRLPVRVMIRELDGYEGGGPDDLERIIALARQIAALRADGLVVAFLRGAEIDGEAMDAVTRAVPGVPITFHHAFDELPDPAAAFRALDRWPQIDRVLTAGGSGDWTARGARLGEYAKAAGPRMVLPGGGVDAEALRVLARTPGIREAHVGRAARTGSDAAGAVDGGRVAALIQAMGT